MWLPLPHAVLLFFFFFNPLGVLAKISKVSVGYLCLWRGRGKKNSPIGFMTFMMFHTVREMEF